MKGQTEIWKSHPEYAGIEVSNLGRVRTLDMVVVSNGRGTYPVKGRVLKQSKDSYGYPGLSIKVDGKWTTKKVHRLVAQTFISNTNGFPMVNHKDGNRANNHIDNLEWCTVSYNNQYREKFGISNTESQGHPVFAINLTTLEVSRFRSQGEASRMLGVNRTHINSVINGKRKQTGGYWFINADDKAVDLTKQKLREIGKTKLTAADTASADFVSQVIAE